MSYDEASELTKYVWSHCQEHMTDLERKGVRAVITRQKAAAAGSESMRRTLLDTWGGGSDPAVAAALANGEEAFKLAVRDRVLRDHPEVVARCPRCNRVLRTPYAKQCRWCFHDWHGR